MQNSRYPILRRIVVIFLGLALLQILLAPVRARYLKVDPYLLTISYSEGGKQVMKTMPTSFTEPLEQVVSGPIQVEMKFPECRAFDRYRFWVGGHGKDSTLRQPSIWRVFVSGNNGNWVEADAEQIAKEYRNNEWYSYHLKDKSTCIDKVRIDIEKLSGSDVLRLYKFQLYESSFMERISEK